jgi:folylpolyglutamate synthase/dihydropteroate synthase
MAMDPSTVATRAGSALDVPAAAFESPSLALAAAVDDAGESGGVIVAGSLYLVGDLREIYTTARDRSAEAHQRYEAEVAEEPEFDLTSDDD